MRRISKRVQDTVRCQMHTLLQDFEAQLTAQLSNMQSDFDEKLSQGRSGGNPIKPLDLTEPSASLDTMTEGLDQLKKDVSDLEDRFDEALSDLEARFDKDQKNYQAKLEGIGHLVCDAEEAHREKLGDVKQAVASKFKDMDEVVGALQVAALSGGPPPKYRWTAGPGWVRVVVPIGNRVRAKDVEVQFIRTKLRVAICRQDAVIDDYLWREINVEESEWVIEINDGSREIVISLQSAAEEDVWDHLVAGEAASEQGLKVCGPCTMQQLVNVVDRIGAELAVTRKQVRALRGHGRALSSPSRSASSSVVATMSAVATAVVEHP